MEARESSGTSREREADIIKQEGSVLESEHCYAPEHVIAAVEYDYKGNLAYRVQLAEDAGELGNPGNDLGRVAPPDEVEFVEEEGGQEGGELGR